MAARRCANGVRREDLSANDQEEIRLFEEYLRVEVARRDGADSNVCDMLVTVIYPDIDAGQRNGGDEMSARYIPLPDENYLPSMGRMLSGGQSATNKQSSGGAVAEVDALEWLAELADVYDHAQRVYESGIRRGIAKEIARLPVPVGRYSRMRASANLRNWLAFLTLRSTAKGLGAQWEIRQYADVVASFVAQAFPRTYELFAGGTL